MTAATMHLSGVKFRSTRTRSGKISLSITQEGSTFKNVLQFLPEQAEKLIKTLRRSLRVS